MVRLKKTKCLFDEEKQTPEGMVSVSQPQTFMSCPKKCKYNYIVDVAPMRHGRWETNSDRPDSLICSVCKRGFDMWKHDPHNYCPNCGAKMDL